MFGGLWRFHCIQTCVGNWIVQKGQSLVIELIQSSRFDLNNSLDLYIKHFHNTMVFSRTCLAFRCSLPPCIHILENIALKYHCYYCLVQFSLNQHVPTGSQNHFPIFSTQLVGNSIFHSTGMIFSSTFHYFLSVLNVGNGWGMGVAGIIINSYCGSFPHSLRLAPVSFGGTPMVKRGRPW